MSENVQDQTGDKVQNKRAGRLHGKASRYSGVLDVFEERLIAIIEELRSVTQVDDRTFDRIVRRHPRPDGMFCKSDIILAFRHLAPRFGWTDEIAFLEKIRSKPVRTNSGVAPVTVLTKPFPCPGKCIFCPNDVQMPKSYLAMEPGAQRATQNSFDPYRQTWSRLRAFHNNGHSLDKIELIILGGTWSSYPEPYQIWFVKRCFEAMNDFFGCSSLPPPEPKALDFLDLTEQIDGRNIEQSYNHIVSNHLRDRLDGNLLPHAESSSWEELLGAQEANETARCRCVGLVVETRPDCTSLEEVRRIRRLGATKVQIGLQSMSDRILTLNNRGHDVSSTRQAMKLLRQAGFKIHAHWMPNLYGSTPEQDVEDFGRLFDDPAVRPDELKIYPCSLIESAELMVEYQAGRWRPYRQDELVDVLVRCLVQVPYYCRVTRVIRDIPSHDILVGNKTNNLREIAEAELVRRGLLVREIRTQQIRGPIPSLEDLEVRKLEYESPVGQEVFLRTLTPEEELVGFLRLLLPTQTAPLEELGKNAIIREVHVYGTVVGIGEHTVKHSQHTGIGRRLIKWAEQLAAKRGHESISVISAVGTRRYYESLGYERGDLFHHKHLSPVT